MKKMTGKLLLLAAFFNGALLAHAQQDNEPAYVALLDAASGGFIVCEFAENGTKTAGMEILEPFLQDGKLYFACIAVATKSDWLKSGLGPGLRPGLVFTLSDASQIKAVYQGPQNLDITPPNYPEGLWVAGFSESDSITITNVFASEQRFKRWLATVKLADF
jgi:hypothetical protein